jgi:diguanylate cyclase (GGDEF)-like protein
MQYKLSLDVSDPIKSIRSRSLVCLSFCLVLQIYYSCFLATSNSTGSLVFVQTGLFSLGAGFILSVCALSIRFDWFKTHYLFLAMYGYLSILLMVTNPSSLSFSWIYVFPVLTYLIETSPRARFINIAFLFSTLSVLFFPQIVDGFNYNFRDAINIALPLLMCSGVLVFVLVLKDKQIKKLANIAGTDSLTGLNNKRALNDLIDYEISRSKREANVFSVAMIDIDHFKSINDTHGHVIGDFALQHISKILKHTCRNTDYAGRWGGEEFLLVLPNTDIAEAFILAERIRAIIATTPLLISGVKVNPTISCGLSVFKPPVNKMGLVMRADECLYKAKARGRNCTEC